MATLISEFEDPPGAAQRPEEPPAVDLAAAAATGDVEALRRAFEAQLAAANKVSRRLGEEKGDLEAALKAESRERARVEKARETLECHLNDANDQMASLREELSRTLGLLAAARDEAAAASMARTELEVEMRSMRHDAEEIRCRPPMVMINGDKDELVPAQSQAIAVETLSAVGIEIEGHIREGLGHSIDAEGIRIAQEFLQRSFD